MTFCTGGELYHKLAAIRRFPNPSGTNMFRLRRDRAAASPHHAPRPCRTSGWSCTCIPLLFPIRRHGTMLCFSLSDEFRWGTFHHASAKLSLFLHAFDFRNPQLKYHIPTFAAIKRFSHFLSERMEARLAVFPIMDIIPIKCRFRHGFYSHMCANRTNIVIRNGNY